MKEKKEISIEFLLKEFDNTYTEWRRMADSGNARLQFLFTVIAVIVSGISISITGLKPDELAFVFVIASAFLTLVGWHAYDYMNIRMIATDVNTRAIARIRRYFIENDPEILPYLTWQTDDKPTRFTIDKKKGMMWVTQITFCILISCLSSSILFLFHRVPNHAAIAFSVTMIVSYFLTKRDIINKIKKYRDLANKDSRFDRLDFSNYEDMVANLHEKISTKIQ